MIRNAELDRLNSGNRGGRWLTVVLVGVLLMMSMLAAGSAVGSNTPTADLSDSTAVTVDDASDASEVLGSTNQSPTVDTLPTADVTAMGPVMEGEVTDMGGHNQTFAQFEYRQTGAAVWRNGLDRTRLSADGGFYTYPLGYAHDESYAHVNEPIGVGENLTLVYYEGDNPDSGDQQFKPYLRDQTYEADGGVNAIWGGGAKGVSNLFSDKRAIVRVAHVGDEVWIYVDGQRTWTATDITQDVVYFSSKEKDNYKNGGNSLRVLGAGAHLPSPGNFSAPLQVGVDIDPNTEYEVRAVAGNATGDVVTFETTTPVETLAPTEMDTAGPVFHGSVDLGGLTGGDAWFEYREAGTSAWLETEETRVTESGGFNLTQPLASNTTYEIRALVDGVAADPVTAQTGEVVSTENATLLDTMGPRLHGELADLGGLDTAFVKFEYRKNESQTWRNGLDRTAISADAARYTSPVGYAHDEGFAHVNEPIPIGENLTLAYYEGDNPDSNDQQFDPYLRDEVYEADGGINAIWSSGSKSVSSLFSGKRAIVRIEHVGDEVAIYVDGQRRWTATDITQDVVYFSSREKDNFKNGGNSLRVLGVGAHLASPDKYSGRLQVGVDIDPNAEYEFRAVAEGAPDDHMTFETGHPVETLEPTDMNTAGPTFRGSVELGALARADAWFEYRESGTTEWLETDRTRLTESGGFNITQPLASNTTYEIRALVDGVTADPVTAQTGEVVSTENATLLDTMGPTLHGELADLGSLDTAFAKFEYHKNNSSTWRNGLDRTAISADGGRYTSPTGFAHDEGYAHVNEPIGLGENLTLVYYEGDNPDSNDQQFDPYLRDEVYEADGGINAIWSSGAKSVSGLFSGKRAIVRIEHVGDTVEIYVDGQRRWTATDITQDVVYFSSRERDNYKQGGNSLRVLGAGAHLASPDAYSVRLQLGEDLDPNAEYEFRAVAEGAPDEHISFETGHPVETLAPTDMNTTGPIFHGSVELGALARADAWFEYREAGTSDWLETDQTTVTESGEFNVTQPLASNTTYEIRALVGGVTADPVTAKTGSFVSTENATLLDTMGPRLHGELVAVGDTAFAQFEYRKAGGSDVWRNGLDRAAISADGGFYTTPFGYAHDEGFAHINEPIGVGENLTLVYYEGDNPDSNDQQFDPYLRDQVYEADGGIDAIWSSGSKSVNGLFPGKQAVVRIEHVGDEVWIYVDGQRTWTATDITQDVVYFSSREKDNYKQGGNSLRLLGAGEHLTNPDKYSVGLQIGQDLDPNAEYEFRAVAEGISDDPIFFETGHPVETLEPTRMDTAGPVFRGSVELGAVPRADAWFEYREAGATEWLETDRTTVTESGAFNITQPLTSNTTYEIRALVDGVTADPVTAETGEVVSTENATLLDTMGPRLHGELANLGSLDTAFARFEYHKNNSSTWRNGLDRTAVSADAAFYTSPRGFAHDEGFAHVNEPIPIGENLTLVYYKGDNPDGNDQQFDPYLRDRVYEADGGIDAIWSSGAKGVSGLFSGKRAIVRIEHIGDKVEIYVDGQRRWTATDITQDVVYFSSREKDNYKHGSNSLRILGAGERLTGPDEYSVRMQLGQDLDPNTGYEFRAVADDAIDGPISFETGHPVETLDPTEMDTAGPVFHGSVELGALARANAWFEYRKAGTSGWMETDRTTVTESGQFTVVQPLASNTTYEIRAVVEGVTAGTVTAETGETVSMDSVALNETMGLALGGSVPDMGGLDTAFAQFEYRESGALVWRNGFDRTRISADGSFYTSPFGYAHDEGYAHINERIEVGENLTLVYYKGDNPDGNDQQFKPYLRDQVYEADGGINAIWGGGAKGVSGLFSGKRATVRIAHVGDEVWIYVDGQRRWTATDITQGAVYFSSRERDNYRSGGNSLRVLGAADRLEEAGTFGSRLQLGQDLRPDTEYEVRTAVSEATSEILSFETGNPVETVGATDVSSGEPTLYGSVELGALARADAWFEYRETGASGWSQTGQATLTESGTFGISHPLAADTDYEFRAVVESVPGETVTLTRSDIDFDITQSDSVVVPGETVSFGLSNVEGTIDTVGWSFGDGETATGETVVHSYDTQGDYVVEATAEGPDGVMVETTSVTVSADLDFSITPSNPAVGEGVSFEAINYDDPGTLAWAFGDGSTSTGASTTHTYSTAGEYNVTLEDTASGETVTKPVVVQEADAFVVSNVSIDGFERPVLTGLEESRPVTVNVSTAADQEFGSVVLDLAGTSTTLDAVDENGTERSWERTVDVSHLDAGGQVTVQFEGVNGSTTEATRRVETTDPPGWIATIEKFSDLFNPQEVSGADRYTLEVDILDHSTVVDSGVSPQWDEDINVTLNVTGSLSVDGETVSLEGTARGAAGIAGVTGGVSLSPRVSYNSDLSLDEADLVTTVFLERTLFEQEVGLDPMYDFLPGWVADHLPSCAVGVEAGIRGELAHQLEFDGGLHPTDDIDRMSFEGGPSLPVGGYGTCGPVTASVSGTPEASAALTFEPELIPSVDGAGVQARIAAAGEVSVEVGVWEGSASGSLKLFNWSFVEGQDPFVGGSTDDPAFGDGEWSRQDARAPVPLTSTADSSGAAAAVSALAPTTADGDIDRVTERAFDDTDPALAPTPGSENRTLLWSSEPESSGEAEPSNIRARVGSAGNWSDPVDVTRSSHHDEVPTLATDGNTTLATWAQLQDADRDIGNVSNPFGEYEIAVATTTDPTDPAAWGEPVRLTDGDAFEYDPAVTAVGDDEWLVVWDRNRAADLDDRDSEAVGYAHLSTAGGNLTVEQQGTIDDARMPALGDGGTPLLAFHRPNGSADGGQVVQGTFDPAAGTFQETATHDVNRLADLSAAGGTLAWIEGWADAPVVTTATANGVTSARPVGEDTTRIDDLTLASQDNRTVLVYRADGARDNSSSRDLLYQVEQNGTWSAEQQLVRGVAGDGSVVLSAPTALATDEGTVIAYGLSERSLDTSKDLAVVERPFGPAHDLSVAVDAPEDPAVGDGVSVTATVENLGVDTGTESVTVNVTDGETVLASGEVGPLVPGETAPVDLTAPVPASGHLVVTLEGADPATDDGPLRQTATETLVTAGLEPAAVEVTRPNATTATAHVTVANAGEADAEPVTVALQDGNDTLGTATAGALSGGERTTVTIPFDPTALSESTSELVVLDPEDELSSSDIEQPTMATWLGQPDVVVDEGVTYTETPGGTIVASVVLSNRGPVDATTTIRAVATGDGQAVGTAEVTLPAAVGGTSQSLEVNVPVGGLDAGAGVQFEAGTERPDSDVSTTAVWDTVGPVLGTVELEPVVGDSPPLDLTGDGHYEDINGDGSFNATDVGVLFEHRDSPAVQHEAWAFAFAGGEMRTQVGIADVQALHDRLGGSGDPPANLDPVDNVTLSVQPSSSTVPAGGQTTFDVVVSDPAAGIGAFDARLSVADDDLVTITDFAVPASPAFGDSAIRADGETLRLTGALGDGSLDGSEVTLATVTVAGAMPGTTAIQPTVEPFPAGLLGNDTRPYDVDTDGAAITVEDSSFAVDILETNTPVAGEDLTVEAAITNEGNLSDTQAVSLSVGDVASDVTLLSLDPGGSTVETFTVATSTDDGGSYTATVGSEDDQASETVEILGASAEFQTDLTTNASVVAGENISVTVTVENTGTLSSEQTVVLDTGGLGANATTEVALDGGTATQETFSVPTSAGDAGTYELAVATDDDRDNTTVEVLEPGALSATITDVDEPVAGNPLSVNATVTNTGGADETQQVTLSTVPDIGQNATTVTLGGGESRNLTLSVPTSDGDGGNYTVVVSTDDATVSESVSVGSGQPDLQLQSLDVPDEVEPGSALNISYTLENTGEISETESSVALVVNGSTEAADANVTVDPGERRNGTLVFQDTASYDPGETISFSVELVDSGDSISALVRVPSNPVGDANGDGTITIADAQAIADFVVGGTPDPFDPNLANVTRAQDGVGIGDAQIVADYVIGGADPANASLSSVTLPETTEVGASLTGNATFENLGGLGTIHQVTYVIATDASFQNVVHKEQVAVADLAPAGFPGDQTTVQFTVDPSLGDGEYTQGLFSEGPESGSAEATTTLTLGSNTTQTSVETETRRAAVR